MIITGNCIEVMPQLEAESFHTCVTSPPYWGLRDYGVEPSYWPEVTYTPPPGQPQQHRPDREDIEYSGMRNKRSVWNVATQAFPEAHYATFPEKLIEPCILAGAPVGGHVLDPFGGSGTTLKVSHENNRECTIIEMGSHNVEIAERRTAVVQPTLIF